MSSLPTDRREFLRLCASSAVALPLTTKRGKILVLGAGLAGLVAALELRNAGFDVTILEANARPGGRVHTLREPFADGLYAEAGAGRIPSTHDLTLRYVKEFNLRLLPFYPSSGASVYFLGGHRFKVDNRHPLPMSQVQLRLNADEQKQGLDALERLYLDDAQREVNRVPPGEWPSAAVLKRYGSLTIADFLRSRGASEVAIDFLVSGYQKEAALDFLRDLASHQAPQLSKIEGGNDRLPRAFAAQLADRIIYGAQVTRIEQARSATSVQFLQSGLRRQATADYLICTLPFKVLRTLEVSPAFSARKQHAIQSMTYGSVSRVYVQTRTRFWEKEGYTGFATVDRPMELWSPTWNQPGRRGLLMTYAYEQLAQEIAAQEPARRVTDMLDYFDRVHPGTKSGFELGTSWVWNEQPFARGAYCFFQPGELDAILPAARDPEGRILFAGEHCSSHPGWMQGALESGLRASDMIRKAVAA